jgi:DNA-binding transcriptional regulator YiaG
VKRGKKQQVVTGPEMDAQELAKIMETNALKTHDLAGLLGEGERTARRHARGQHRIPGSKAILMRLLHRGRITLNDIKRASR